MKKNYTLKLVLAMLVVVLVSLVSFVGVYKGKNLVKDYSLGKDFGKRKIALFSVVEKSTAEKAAQTEGTEQTATESNENSESNAEAEQNKEAEAATENKVDVQPMSEKEKKKQFNEAKNNITRRLSAMKSEEFDIRLNEENGSLVIEVPETMDTTFLTEVVSKGKVEIKNTTTNEIVADGKVFKDASASLKTQSFSNGMQQVTKKIVVLNFKLTKEGKNKITSANVMNKKENGEEEECKFAIVLDGTSLYSDNASSFIESAQKNNGFELYMGQNDEGEELDKDYQVALATTAIIKCGEIPVEYGIDSIELVSSNFSMKLMIIVAALGGVIMLVLAALKFKSKGILPVISLVGLVASILLTLRYANVKITLFSVLAIAIITIASYVVIIKSLGNKNTFKDNFMNVMCRLTPSIIVALVFCFSPYMQLASFGLTMFWGLIVMSVYNFVIVRTFINK